VRSPVRPPPSCPRRLPRMSSGLLLGLGAALAWGLVDIAAALAGRRFGSLRTVLVTQTVGVAALVVVGVVSLLGGAPFPILDGPSVAIAALCGLFACLTYLAFFTSLRIGPVSVVSPVVSAYGGLTVLLAVLIRGESMTPLQAAGAVVSSVGVVLIGLTFAGGWRATRVAGPGIAFALVALVGFAAVTVAMADPIRTMGWLPALIVARTTNALLGSVLLVIALARKPRWAGPLVEICGSPAGRAAGWSPKTAIVLAGLLDVGGLVSFGIGLETSLVWLVGLASSFGPVFAVTVAVLFLGERPRSVQWLGIVGIAAGIVLIGLR